MLAGTRRSTKSDLTLTGVEKVGECSDLQPDKGGGGKKEPLSLSKQRQSHRLLKSLIVVITQERSRLRENEEEETRN